MINQTLKMGINSWIRISRDKSSYISETVYDLRRVLNGGYMSEHRKIIT